MGLFQYLVRVTLFLSSLLVYSYFDLIDLKLNLPGPLHSVSAPLLHIVGLTIKSSASSLTAAVTFFVILLVAFILSGGRSLRSLASVMGMATLIVAAFWNPVKSDPAQKKFSQICFLTYFVSSAIYFLCSPSHAGGGTDDVVRFKPYEAQIRQFLLKHDPSRLHKVDGMLEREYKGRGQELLKKLEQEYAVQPASSSVRDTSRTQPRGPTAAPAAYNRPRPGPVMEPPAAAHATTAPRMDTQWQQSGGGGSGRYGVHDDEDEYVGGGGVESNKDLVRQAALQYQEDVRRRQEERINRLHMRQTPSYPSYYSGGR